MEKITPRVFEKSEFLNGSVLNDFASCIDELSNFDSYEIPKDENESLSNLGLEVLKRLNNSIPATIRSLPNPERRGLIELISNHLNTGKYRISEDLQEQYDAAFSDSNEWVREKFFPHMAKLFKSRTATSSFCHSTDDELNQMAAMISHLWSMRKLN
jgi:hypothetical protein